MYSFFAECRFGDQTFELEQTWHPDLGPPFGVMYCVHCECVPVSVNIYRYIFGLAQLALISALTTH